ncbi:MAG: hypothetical protein L0387_40090 [Acidobacteria bacterium]|nr:hypothetical protein [Acidobacteriota bacterium]
MSGANRYRRAFDWRLSTVDDDAKRRALATIRTLAQPEVVEVLEDYLELSRKRRENRLALARLQLALLRELEGSELTCKVYREEERNHQARLASAQAEAESAQVKQLLDLTGIKLLHQGLLSNCVRTIGDGIAWRAFNYDRAALRTLSERPTKQQVLAQGTDQEIVEWWNRTSSWDCVAILNMLTNYLAIGDVTMVRDDGGIEIIEVKSSGTKNRRLRRQKEAMREVVELLSQGQGETDGGRPTEFLVCDVYPENGLKEVLPLIQEAKRTGFAWRRLSNSLYVEVVAPQAVQDGEKVLGFLNERRSQTLADWEARDDVTVGGQTLDYLKFSPNIAPFTVFPFPSRICVELLLGVVVFGSILNASAVAREFEHRGWRVTKSPKEFLEQNKTLDHGFLAVAKEGWEVEVGPAWMNRMHFETLRPQVVIQTLDQVLKMGHGKIPRHPFVVLSDEAKMWD